MIPKSGRTSEPAADPRTEVPLDLSARYDRDAGIYRELWAPILRIAGLRLVSELADAPASRVVDVATGVGSLLGDLRAAFPKALVLGVDRSRGMLALAPAEYPRAVMDATRLALASESADLVMLAFMLFHLEQPIDGLREARRVLCPGGRVGTLTWGGDFESQAIRIWTECLDAHGAAPSEASTTTRHDSVDAPEKMESLLRGAGFATVRSWVEELATTIDAEHLIRLRTRMGSERPRFDSLAPEAKTACVDEARGRLRELAPEDFIARVSVVYALATA